MAKWNETPGGILATGVSKLLFELGDHSSNVLARLANDPTFARNSSHALVDLLEGKPRRPRKDGITLDSIKQIMGSRCFLPSELPLLLDGMTSREVSFLPELTASQLRGLSKFLLGSCPIHPAYQARETHILLPMPGIIAGVTLDVNSIAQRCSKSPKIQMELGTISCDHTFGCPRFPKWYVVFMGHDGTLSVPRTQSKEMTHIEDQAQMLPQGYKVPDPTLLAFTIWLWSRRVPMVKHDHVRTSAIGRNAQFHSGVDGPVIVGTIYSGGITIYAESDNRLRTDHGIAACRCIA